MKRQYARSIFLAVLWMAFIFYLSSQPAKTSDRLSKSVAKAVITCTDLMRGKAASSAGVASDASKREFDRRVSLMNNKIREYAHSAIYFVLAMFLYIVLSKFRIKKIGIFLFSFLFCAAFAASDEFHQMFVPGRGVQLSDFALDCTGALLGLGLCRLLLAFDLFVD